jgi:hypothetical protein
MRGPALSVVALGFLAVACSFFGAGDRSSSHRTASAGETIDSADAGPPCWDSSNVVLCVGSTFRQCAPVAGEGCVRCTCAVGTRSTEARWNSDSTWNDRGDQNLMAQPRVP